MRPIDVLTSPWAIVPEKFSEIKEIYSRHLRGEQIDLQALEAQLGKPLNNERKPYQVQDGVALLPLDGVVAKKMNMFTQISGGISMQIFAQDFRAALADPGVNAIVMIIDSPGGTVDGTQELARIIMAARSHDKPVVAWVDGMMASAAYWIGSAASAIYIGAGTDAIGSIGVAMEHVDYSAYEAKAGIKTTDIFAGKYKRIASSNAPLTEEGRAYLQNQVDTIYTLFVDSVAQHRGVSSERVLSDMADGRIFIGQQAIDAGLVDGFSTLESLIQGLKAGKQSATLISADVRTSPTMRENHMSTTTKETPEAIEARARSTWARDADLRAEFDSFESYIAYEKAAAAGKVKNMSTTTKETPEAIEARARSTWARDAEIQAEFDSFESYIAYEKAAAAGKVKIFGGAVRQYSK